MDRKMQHVGVTEWSFGVNKLQQKTTQADIESNYSWTLQGESMPIATVSSPVALLPTRALAPQLPSKRDIRLEAGAYVARLALTEQELAAAYRLRFLVFNLGLNERVSSSYADGYDKDHFDDVCDHLIVEEGTTGAIVGTYRLQMVDVAGAAFGYFTERGFCFAPCEGLREEVVE